MFDRYIQDPKIKVLATIMRLFAGDAQISQNFTSEIGREMQQPDAHLKGELSAQELR